jgi:hypothetical protein
MIGRRWPRSSGPAARTAKTGVDRRAAPLQAGELFIDVADVAAPAGTQAIAGLLAPTPSNSPLLQMYIDHCLSSHVR